MASPRALRITALVLAVLAALMFANSGIGKLMNAETAGGIRYDAQFVVWGYPEWFRFVVGGAELLLAGLLLAPRTRFVGAVGLLGLMLGAIVTHLRTPGEAPYAIVPLVFALVAATIAVLTRPADLKRPFGPSLVAQRADAAKPSIEGSSQA